MQNIADNFFNSSTSRCYDNMEGTVAAYVAGLVTYYFLLCLP